MADVPHQTQEDGPPWQEIVAEWWSADTSGFRRWPQRPAEFFTTDTITCLGGLLVNDGWARLARELDIDFCVGLSQTKRISTYPPFVVMHRWCTKHEDNWPMLFEAILKIGRFAVLHAVVTAVSRARRSRGLKEPFHLMLQVKCESPDAIVDTPPEVAVPRQAQENLGAWWTTSAPWPTRPSEFFDIVGTKCLGSLATSFTLLAIGLKVSSTAELAEFKRDPISPQLAVVRAWCSRGDNTWPWFFKAILEVGPITFQAVVEEVAQCRRVLGLEGPICANLKDVLMSWIAQGKSAWITQTKESVVLSRAGMARIESLLHTSREDEHYAQDDESAHGSDPYHFPSLRTCTTPPAVAVPRQAQKNSAAWWTTSTPWPERPCDFFDESATFECLEGLKEYGSFVRLAIKLDVASQAELEIFARDSCSTPLAIVRGWYNKEVSDWPTLFKAILEIKDSAFIAVVMDVAQARRERGLEGLELGNVRDALDRPDELGTAACQIKARKLTFHEAIQLSEALELGWEPVQRAICALIQDTDDADPLDYKMRCKNQWISGSRQTFVQAHHYDIDSTLIVEALRRTGHLQIAKEILPLDTLVQEGRSDLPADRVQESGSSPAVPAETTPEADAPRQAQENPDAWWTTSTPWPSRPSEFFDTAGLTCLRHLDVDNIWILLATELNVNSGRGLDEFRSGPVSPQLAVVRKWYSQGVDDWPVLFKAIKNVCFVTFMFIVFEVSQNRRAIDLEGTTYERVDAALKSGLALVPTRTVLESLRDNAEDEEHSYAQDNESAHGSSPSEPAATTHEDISMSDHETKECAVCMDGEPTTAFVPCGHVCCCFDCATTCAEGGSCPVCRAAVASVLKVYT